MAAHYAQQPALQSGEHVVTFQELDEQSDRIAAGLGAVVAAPEARVLLLFALAAPAAVPALFGVLKAGACYAALDPNAPLARSRAVWDNADPCALLTDQAHAALALDIAQGQAPVLLVEELLACQDTVPDPAIDPDQLAALLYTSGSTGTPKAIERTHRQLLRRVRASTRERGVNARDRLVLSHFIGYSPSTTPLFAGLLNGAIVLTLDLQALSMGDLEAYLRREAITTLSLPNGLFRRLAEHAGSRRLDLPHLRLIIFGGEPLLKHDVDLFQRHFPLTCTAWNGLAITESGL